MRPVNKKLWETLGSLRGQIKLDVEDPKVVEDLLNTLDKVEEEIRNSK